MMYGYILKENKLSQKLSNLGRMKIYKNDILVLEINEYGVLKKIKNFTISR